MSEKNTEKRKKKEKEVILEQIFEVYDIEHEGEEE